LLGATAFAFGIFNCSAASGNLDPGEDRLTEITRHLPECSLRHKE
jgi:hypothetical protein